MISSIIRPEGRNYICDDCKSEIRVFKSHKAALAAGWAISRNYKLCYCPRCAPAHRHVGRKKAQG